MSKILVTRKIPKSGYDILKNDASFEIISWDSEEIMPYEKILEVAKENQGELKGIHCLLTDKIDKAVLDAAGSNLKCISTMSVGYNHIDVEECKKRGIKLGYTPEVLTDATAELAVSLLMSVSRMLPQASIAVKDGSWGSWKPEWMCGNEVCGSTVGVIGMGRIGTRFAEMMKNGFNCRIVYNSRQDKDLSWAEYKSLDEVLSMSDFVVPHCSLTNETKELFNLDAFKKMKKDAIFINTTRGDVVNQEDLYTALTEGIIKAAGLDVCSPEPLPTNHKLLTLENCLILPHIGSATIRTREIMSQISAKNLIAGMNGTKMIYEI